MPIPIKEFSDGSKLEFDKGNFDSWCVYHRLKDGTRYAPKDIDYFDKLSSLSHKHKNTTIYIDFVEIFNSTTNSIDVKVLSKIEELSQKYNEDKLIM